MSMHPCFHAQTTPDKPAFIIADSGEQVSYGQLDVVSNQGAQLLRQLGLNVGDHIAVMIENCAEFFYTTWAANRAGLYFTPISTSLQVDEISYIVENCGAKVFIASGSLTEKLDLNTLALPMECLRFMVNGTAAPGYRDWDAEVATMPAEPVSDECEGLFMMYSSGTTGRPKGIKRPFEQGPPGEGNGAGNYPMMQQFLYGAGADSVFLSPAPLYHSAPLYWCQAYMRLGATVIVMQKFDPERALQLVEQYRVTHSQWVPTMFVRMLKLDQAVREQYDLASLKCAVHAAAPCPVPVKEQLIDWWGPVVHEYYTGSEGNGMTVISPQEWLEHKGSVGRPVYGELHIVDEETGEELPSGEVGTVYFGGGSDFEYHGDPEKSRSVRHPKGWTTLGDVGYVDEEGFLYLTDRKAYMIISGGVNIYPQETENLIITHDQVADVAVIGVPNEDFGEEVKAVVQPKSMAAATPALAQEIIEFCRANLSHIKCPRSVDFCEELPRTPTGKLLKRVLKERY